MLTAVLALLLCFSGCQTGEVRETDNTPEETVEPQPAEAQNTEAQYAETEITETQTPANPAPSEENEESDEIMIYAHIGDKTLTIRPEGNSSSEAFLEMLAGGDVAVDMHDYGSFEKVGALGASLPANDERITTEPGDVILYQGDQITIYYGTNTWSFTRLGKVQGMTQSELKDALGDGDPTVVFSLQK